MRMTDECILCTMTHMRSLYNGLEENDDKRVSFMKRMCGIVARSSDEITAPALNAEIMPVVENELGRVDLFSKEKHFFNQAVLKIEDEIWQHIAAAEDKLYRAIQYAMTGNYIDFGPTMNVNEEKLHELIEKAPEIDLGDVYDRFRSDLDEAQSLVFIHDNCGEIVFDKMCIAEIKALYPDMKITSVVRGGPIVNDVTIKDAKEVGLTDIVPVVGSGQAVQGIVLKKISSEARALMTSADVIIAKGMGNYETLEGCGLPIYYLLLCKCERFMKVFGKPYLSSVFAAERG